MITLRRTSGAFLYLSKRIQDIATRDKPKCEFNLCFPTKPNEHSCRIVHCKPFVLSFYPVLDSDKVATLRICNMVFYLHIVDVRDFMGAHISLRQLFERSISVYVDDIVRILCGRIVNHREVIDEIIAIKCQYKPELYSWKGTTRSVGGVL